MIRSLFNLTQRINTHITNIPHKKDFDLHEVKTLLDKYNGHDWYEYKIKNSSPVYSECVNNYMKIPIVFKELQNNNFSKDIYGMYLVVWNPYCETSIHNHPEGGCLMKILEGNITQHKFRSNEMLTETQELRKNDICYINDNIGLHRISNNNMNYSYSLHLYSPALLDSEVNNNNFKSKSTLLLPESKINHCLLAAK